MDKNSMIRAAIAVNEDESGTVIGDEQDIFRIVCAGCMALEKQGWDMRMVHKALLDTSYGKVGKQKMEVQ